MPERRLHPIPVVSRIALAGAGAVLASLALLLLAMVAALRAMLPATVSALLAAALGASLSFMLVRRSTPAHAVSGSSIALGVRVVDVHRLGLQRVVPMACVAFSCHATAESAHLTGGAAAEAGRLTPVS